MSTESQSAGNKELRRTPDERQDHDTSGNGRGVVHVVLVDGHDGGESEDL